MRQDVAANASLASGGYVNFIPLNSKGLHACRFRHVGEKLHLQILYW